MSAPSTGSSVLDTILARTRERVASESRSQPVGDLQALATEAPPARPFAAALARPDSVNVIAEHKRRSPSRGAIREDLRPADVAQAYEAAGAAALSVLTDEPFFGGRLEHLVAARAATSLPVLRKDFVVDSWQIWQARAAGADAVLLIVAALDDEGLRRLLDETARAGLEALVEVHDRAELDRALRAGAHVVGVNNRNLKTMTVSLDTSLSLAPSLPAGVVAVAESGIRSADDVRRLRETGFSAFLIGESLMGAPEPGAALRSLLEASA